MVSLFKDLCFIYQFFNALTGVNNVKATDRRRRYGSDGAQPCAQHRKPWLYRLYFQPFP